jgi:hypothetical protein
MPNQVQDWMLRAVKQIRANWWHSGVPDESIAQIIADHAPGAEPMPVPTTPKCLSYDECDGDLPGEWHEKNCPCYVEEVDGVMAADWERRKPELDAEFVKFKAQREAKPLPAVSPRYEWTPEVETARKLLMEKFSDQFSMEAIAEAAYILGGKVSAGAVSSASRPYEVGESERMKDPQPAKLVKAMTEAQEDGREAVSPTNEFSRGRLFQFQRMKDKRPLDPVYWDMHELRELKAAVSPEPQEKK